ncbi:hypothetical protein, partial [Lysinibacillus sp. NPDC047702]|uniref:hypothetical protein n=1 Tax=unclassified Lysinibacillus TaxID=2636778 RepID=UPI003CFE4F95
IDTAIKGLENDKANSEDLTSLEQTVTEHLAEVVWHDVILLNGWEPYKVGYEPKFTIDKHNNLIIKGTIKNGVTTRNTTIFELPEGVRPTTYRTFIVGNNNQNIDNFQFTVVGISVSPSGNVNLDTVVPYTQLLTLDEIRIQM